MSNISETIQKAAEILLAADVAESRRQANSLLSLAIQKDRTFLLSHPEYELTVPEEALFWEFVMRRATREPFQHIAGKQEFFGLDFEVSREVLIPRPETEMLVEKAIGLLSSTVNPRFCEVGIGSGCISVSILHNLRTARGIGLDISESALEIAAKNARRHDVSERLTICRSDVFEILRNENFDLIVSNPPYIAEKDLALLEPEVREFDPRIALTDGKDGLTLIHRIVRSAPDHLKPNGHLLVEIGDGQAAAVGEMFLPESWNLLEIEPDLQSIPRMVVARING